MEKIHTDVLYRSRETYHRFRANAFIPDSLDESDRKRSLWPGRQMKHFLRGVVTREVIFSNGSKCCAGIGWNCECLVGRVCKRYRRTLYARKQRCGMCLEDKEK